MSAPIYHLIPNAPKPVAPYSHVVEADGWLFVTGQLATDPDDDSLPLPEGIEADPQSDGHRIFQARPAAGADHGRGHASGTRRHRRNRFDRSPFLSGNRIATARY
jgi:hypothetical protein